MKGDLQNGAENDYTAGKNCKGNESRGKGQSKGWTTFDEMQADREAVQADYDRLEKSRSDMDDRMGYLEGLLGYYNDHYEHYHEINAGYWKLKKAEEKTASLSGSSKRARHSSIRCSTRQR